MEPKKLFDDIARYVDESRKLLESGAMMELAGLDKRVEALCGEVLSLSQDEQAHYADRLKQLFLDIESLEKEMITRRDAIADEIRSLPQHKKASTAYRVVEASDRRDNEDD